MPVNVSHCSVAWDPMLEMGLNYLQHKQLCYELSTDERHLNQLVVTYEHYGRKSAHHKQILLLFRCTKEAL